MLPNDLAQELPKLQRKQDQIGSFLLDARIQQSEAVRYVVGAMQPIDSEYTKNTYEQADRVINQLKKGLKSSCSYDFQGSVTNNTHIKARSDIDVLLLTDKFFTLEPPQQPASRYQGDVLQDLLDLRTDAASVLRAAFPEATVDSGGSKSISIEGGSGPNNSRKLCEFLPLPD